MAARPRTTFDKLQRERARQEKQAAKRARRQGQAVDEPGRPVYRDTPEDAVTPPGDTPAD